MSATAPKISAVGIKRLWYCDPDKISADLTGTLLANLLADNTIKEVENIHQDTWTYEESEASQDSYKNQLTGSVYRMGTKTMGEVSANFTIGQYDYATKAEFCGGEVIGGGTGWKRARGVVDIRKAIIFLTEDNQYGVLPYTNVNTHEANTDKALGIAVKATAMEPQNTAVRPEYWFDGSVVASGS